LKAGRSGGVLDPGAAVALDPGPGPGRAAASRPSTGDDEVRSIAAQATATSRGLNDGFGAAGLVNPGSAGSPGSAGALAAIAVVDEGGCAREPTPRGRSSSSSLEPAADGKSARPSGPPESDPATGRLRASSLASARANVCSGAFSGATKGLAARAALRARAGSDSDDGAGGSAAPSRNRAVDKCEGSSWSPEGSKVATTGGRSASEARTVR
jgi:hypothetical protein